MTDGLFNPTSGFPVFRKTISEIADGLGNPSFRYAVANHMIQFLGLAMAGRRGDRYSGLYAASGSKWATAWDDDFDVAVLRGRAFFTKELVPATAKASWKGSTLALRGHDVVVEGGGFSMFVAHCFESSHRQQEQWQVTFNDSGARCINGDDSTLIMSSKPMTVHAKSEGAAVKSLRAIVERFCGVAFTNQDC